jgi:ElaB/YqjD/DUF883 family membrane-anchored ribosome-binding protein
MSVDLKPMLDVARQASEDVQQILDEMTAAFNEGTDEGKAKALELRPELEKAQKKAQEANDLYVAARNASMTSDSAAKNFVPVPDNPADSNSNPREMKRDEFTALDAAERMKFILAGGTVVDPD